MDRGREQQREHIRTRQGERRKDKLARGLENRKTEDFVHKKDSCHM